MKKNIKKYKKLLFIVVALSFFAILFFFMKGRKDNGEISYQVKKEIVSDELIFAGVVDAEKRVDLGFALGGRIIKNLIKEGDFVKKGQLLAEIDQSAVRANLAQARAQYKLVYVDSNNNAKNTLSSYEALKKEQDTLVKNAYQQYISGDLRAYLVDEKNLHYAYTPPIVSGNYIGEKEGVYKISLYRSASASGFSYKLSGLEDGIYTAEVNQAAPLGEKGLYLQFASGVNYGDKNWEIPVPNTRSTTYLVRKTAYENTLAQRERVLRDAKNNLNKFNKKNNQLNLSYKDAQIQSARTQIYASQIRLSDGKIIAPFDAYVVKNNLELGETVQALTSQITLFANKKRKITLNTPELYINKIHINDEVKVTLDAYPDISFIGHIVKIDDIDTLVDGVPVYETEVLMDNIDDRMRVGMNAHALIVVSKKEDVLAIPKHFIQKKDEDNIVFVVSNSGIAEQIIETGIEGNNSLVEVLSGLSVGDIITNKNN